MQTDIPVLGFAAYSGTGKTTLLEQLIPILNSRGIRLSLIKHAHHEFDIDQKGKDSYRLRKAGALETIVASGSRWALIHENPTRMPEPNLAELLERLDKSQIDLVLVEGFKHEPVPRIELWRKPLSKPLLFADDDRIIAIASDERIEPEPDIPNLDINQPQQIAEFIVQFLANSE